MGAKEEVDLLWDGVMLCPMELREIREVCKIRKVQIDCIIETPSLRLIAH